MKHSNTFFIILCLVLVSCTSKPDPDIALIETIENNLLPSVLVEGEEVDDMNILERMEHYHIPGVSIAFLNEGEIVWAKGYGYTSSDSTAGVKNSRSHNRAMFCKCVGQIF